MTIWTRFLFARFHCEGARGPLGTRDRDGGGGPPYNVFFGNVPYDATEERLREMFSEGPVHDLRCVSGDAASASPAGGASISSARACLPDRARAPLTFVPARPRSSPTD